MGGHTVTDSPYISLPSNIYKGNVHAHSNVSDGTGTPAEMVTAYKNAGCDFCALTDHDTYDSGAHWLPLVTDPGVAGILFILGCEETASDVSSGHQHLASLDV
jgi:predicted metal-dependent phosphoesterase TrpH